MAYILYSLIYQLPIYLLPYTVTTYIVTVYVDIDPYSCDLCSHGLHRNELHGYVVIAAYIGMPYVVTVCIGMAYIVMP